MFQKEVADRIIAEFNTSNYGRLSIICNWKLNIKKICDIEPEAFSPKPKIQSSLLLFHPKKNFIKINHKKILQIYYNSSISVVPSRWEEPFGRTAMESAAHGCATITSKKGGLLETFDNDLYLNELKSSEIFKKIENFIIKYKKTSIDPPLV